MEKNIENGKNFVTTDSVKEDNNMSNATYVEFWEDGYTIPDEFRLWNEVPNYNKFRSVMEMEDSEAFFALLIRNENLRNTKSYRELKEMSKKYAEECLKAERDTKSKHDKKYFDDLIRRGYNPVIERSANLYKEEVETFMEYVRQAEWLQYIEQSAEEIHQILLSKASSGRPSTYF